MGAKIKTRARRAKCQVRRESDSFSSRYGALRFVVFCSPSLSHHGRICIAAFHFTGAYAVMRCRPGNAWHSSTGARLHWSVRLGISIICEGCGGRWVDIAKGWVWEDRASPDKLVDLYLDKSKSRDRRYITENWFQFSRNWNFDRLMFDLQWAWFVETRLTFLREKYLGIRKGVNSDFVIRTIRMLLNNF